MLGLADPAEGAAPATDWREWAGKTVPGTVFDQPEPEELIELTVIVPARNEEDCLGECLQSLVSQSEEIFELGQRLGADRGGRSLDRPDGRDRARLCRRDAAGGGQAGAGLDGQGQRRLDGGAAAREAAGCCLPMRTRSTSRATCAAPCTRRSGTRRAC